MIRTSCRYRLGAILVFVFVLATEFLTGMIANSDPLPDVSFAERESTATEQNGHIELKVAFSREFSGRLTYAIEGTAEQGTDFDSLEVVPAQSGSPVREMAIIIRLREDDLVEDVETIRVTLQPSEEFRLGAAQEHTITIRDNDANWQVVQDVDGMKFAYRIQIIRDGESTVATVTSDGRTGLPAGAYPAELTVDDNQFKAVISPITVAAGQTLLGAEVTRTFTLLAVPPGGRQSIDYERPLIGTVTETWAAKEASHLIPRNPISGTFLISRISAGATPADDGEEVEETTGANAALADREGTSECDVAAMSGASDFTVKPSSQDLATSPFAPHIPYPNFINDTLERARAELYYDKAPTQEAKDVAAFRYKALLYEKEGVGAEAFIRAQFDKMEDLWDCAARKRAHQTAGSIIDALRYAPWSRELRWALLDIYYDIAVAEKALAQERHVSVAEIMIRPLALGEPLINQEIAQLEQALPLYRNALAGYMKVLQRTFGVNLADFETDSELLEQPFGYYMFRKEVPSRSPFAALLKNADGDWVLPVDSDVDVERPQLFQGYKDLTLLFELLREYLRTAEQLSKRYVMRGEPSDFQRAESLIGTALLATYLEGNALLAMFPEIREQSAQIDPTSGLREAVAGWRHSYSALGHIRGLLRGNTNPLGFTDDFLVLVQSVIPGEPESRFFNSYDFLSHYLSNGGPLERAERHHERAWKDYDSYRDRSDVLAQQFADRAEQYDERLTKIVGVRPGKPGYADPTQNDGGLISQRLSNIELARLRVDRNRQRVQNLKAEIRTELWRRGQAAGINDAISQVYIDFGNMQATLTDEIAEIQASQVASSHSSSMLGSWLTAVVGIAAAPLTGGASLFLTAAAAPNFISSMRDAETQPTMEINRVRLQALKERHAARERAQVQSLQGDLLDVNSRALVRNLLRHMSILCIESAEATAMLQQEMQQLAALYLEKADLERRKAESNERLADRYFADPSHRLLKNASVLRAEFSFTDAQRWMFLAIRTAEYKWNQAFRHTAYAGLTFTMQTLFKARNARELRDLFDALADWDRNISIGVRNDDGYKKFSIREDFLGYKEGGTYFHPETGEQLEAWTAFQHFIRQEENYLGPEDPDNPIPGFKVLRLSFNTAATPDTGGLFLRNRWLEKVEFLRVKLRGGAVGGINSTVDGYLTYGGVSLIRNQSPGSRGSHNADGWVNETTAYSTQYWFYQNGQWRSKEAFGSPISVQISNDPDVPPEIYQINSFQEYSVATSDWTLYVAVERNGRPLVDLGNLTDIEFHINYYWYARN